MSDSILPTSNKRAIPIGNLPFGAADYDWRVAHKIKNDETPTVAMAYMAEVQARRRVRLQLLIDDVGGQANAVERFEKNQGQLSQLSNGKKSIGEALARDLEQRAGKPFGWLDVDEEQGRRIPKSITQDEFARKLWAMWPKLTTADRRELCAWAAGSLRRRRGDTGKGGLPLRQGPRDP